MPYAAKLKAGDVVDWIPFFVRPKRGTATATIAFLAPTFTYLAYSGFRNNVPYLQGLYDRHPDWAGVMYTSRLKPVPEMRPNWPRRRHDVADLEGVEQYLGQGGRFMLIGDFPSLMKTGAAGDELDRYDPALGSPPHASMLATSTGFLPR